MNITEGWRLQGTTDASPPGSYEWPGLKQHRIYPIICVINPIYCFLLGKPSLKKEGFFVKKNHKMATLPPPFMRKQIIKDGGGIATL